jgi:hypothetical protein
MLGKTPMWGKPMREIYLYNYMKVYINNNNKISSKRNPLTTHKNYPHNILPSKACQIHTIVCPYQKSTPWKMCPQDVYEQLYTTLLGYYSKKNPPKQSQKPFQTCLDFHALFPLLYELYQLYKSV